MPVRVRRTHQRERGHRQPDAGGGGALADDDVELEVLHRRIQDLLDRPGEPMDLVDEQHVAVFELRQDRGQVAGTFERRTRRDVQVHAHLGGDDSGERGLAESGRAREQEVIDRLATLACRLEDDVQMLLEFALPHELVECLRSKARLGIEFGLDEIVVGLAHVRVEELLTHAWPPATSRRLAAASRSGRHSAGHAALRGSRRCHSRAR